MLDSVASSLGVVMRSCSIVVAFLIAFYPIAEAADRSSDSCTGDCAQDTVRVHYLDLIKQASAGDESACKEIREALRSGSPNSICCLVVLLPEKLGYLLDEELQHIASRQEEGVLLAVLLVGSSIELKHAVLIAEKLQNSDNYLFARTAKKYLCQNGSKSHCEEVVAAYNSACSVRREGSVGIIFGPFGFYPSKEKNGVAVNYICKGSAAERADLRAGDVIVSVNNEQINDTGDLREALSAITASNIIFRVRRMKKTIKIDLTR